MKTTVLALAATCLLLACKKNEEPSDCYECQSIYTAFGRGVATIDTACGTESDIQQRESNARIDNDSIQREMHCHLLRK